MLCNMHPHSWWCIYYIHITMSMSDNYIPGAKINLVRVPTYVRFMKRSSISTYYHNKFSTISGPVFQECTGSWHENVPTSKAGGTESWFFPVYCLFCLKKYAALNPVILQITESWLKRQNLIFYTKLLNFEILIGSCSYSAITMAGLVNFCPKIDVND